MTILERLLGHDAWTTRQLLLRCPEFSEEQMDRNFEIGDKSLRETLHHIIAAMESHTRRLYGRNLTDSLPEGKSVDEMLDRLTAVAKLLGDFALKMEREGREDELVVVNLQNGYSRTAGGVVAHILTHGMHHRAQAISIMEQLGAKDVIEGDVLGWESVIRGWGWRDGGSDGKMMAE